MAKEYLKKNKVSKVLYTNCETQTVIEDPLGANAVHQSRFYADIFTTVVYNTSSIDNDDKVNAFRHAIWNALGVRDLCYMSFNKWRSLHRMKIFGNAHECYGNQVSNANDLSNNLVGRTYMYDTVGQSWLGTANNIPGVEK